MLACLLAVGSVVAIAPHDGHAKPLSPTEAAHGVVRHGAFARPMLAYDMAALGRSRGDDGAPPPRLNYAGYDRPGNFDELRTAHHLAAEIVRAFDMAPVADAVLLGR